MKTEATTRQAKVAATAAMERKAAAKARQKAADEARQKTLQAMARRVKALKPSTNVAKNATKILAKDAAFGLGSTVTMNYLVQQAALKAQLEDLTTAGDEDKKDEEADEQKSETKNTIYRYTLPAAVGVAAAAAVGPPLSKRALVGTGAGLLTKQLLHEFIDSSSAISAT